MKHSYNRPSRFLSCTPSTTILVALGIATSLLNIPAHAQALYISNPGANDVLKELGGTTTVFSSGGDLDFPSGLAVDSNGNVYVTNNNSGTITKITPGGVQSNFASGLINPTGLAFNASGILFAVSQRDDTIYELTPGGSMSTFILGGTAVDGPEGIAFDKNDNLYVVNYTSSTISEITPAKVVTPFASLTQGAGVAVDTQGDVFATCYNANTITEFYAGGGSHVFASSANGLNGPGGLVFDASGNLYVANILGNTVEEFTPGGNLIGTLSSNEMNLPYYLAFAPSSIGSSTPEPDSVGLLTGLGVSGLGLFARRRRK